MYIYVSFLDENFQIVGKLIRILKRYITNICVLAREIFTRNFRLLSIIATEKKFHNAKERD